MNNKFKLEILGIVDSARIIIKGNYAWKFSLNADSETGGHVFSLPLTPLNVIKIRNITSSDFSHITNYSFPHFPKEKKKLRDYQEEDINFLSKLKSVAIFNEMRTGKTPTSLMLTQRWSVDNLIIITPNILQRHWQVSVEEWLDIPAYVISQLPGRDRRIFYEKFINERKIVLVISKDIFKNDYQYFRKLRSSFSGKKLDFCVIVDESHYLRNYNSQQSKGIYSLSDSTHKIVLTGTPFVNNHADIFGTMKFIMPDKYKSYWKFVASFFNIKNLEFTRGLRRLSIKTIAGFKSWEDKIRFKREISSFSTRRRQKEILPWLPKIIYQKELLIMDKAQQKMYDGWIQKKKSSPEMLFNLKSIILYPPYLDQNVKSAGVKIDYLVSFCKENVNKQIVVFSTRSDTFLQPLSSLLKEQKVEFGIIVGTSSQKQRQLDLERFQNSELKILLCNIQSAGFGVELSAADTVIFADRSYSPADNEQAEARFLPTTQNHDGKIKLVIDLVCKNTIDEKILKLLEKKKNIMSIINHRPHLILDK